jgi:hypothetical protein
MSKPTTTGVIRLLSLHHQEGLLAPQLLVVEVDIIAQFLPYLKIMRD